MSIYNVALSLILIFANWLFISSYLNIYKFFDYERNNNIPNNIPTWISFNISLISPPIFTLPVAMPLTIIVEDCVAMFPPIPKF